MPTASTTIQNQHLRARAVAPAAASQLQESAVLSEFAPVVGEWMSLQGVRWSAKHPIRALVGDVTNKVKTSGQGMRCTVTEAYRGGFADIESGDFLLVSQQRGSRMQATRSGV